MWHCIIAPLVTDRLSEPCREMPLEKQCFSSWGNIARVYPSSVITYSWSYSPMLLQGSNSEAADLRNALLTVFLLRGNFHFS